MPCRTSISLRRRIMTITCRSLFPRQLCRRLRRWTRGALNFRGPGISAFSVYSLRCSAAFRACTAVGHHAAKQPFVDEISGLVSRLLVGPLEFPVLCLWQCDSGTSAIEALLVCSSASAIALNEVPARVHADRPLELELASVGLFAGNGTAESLASWLCAHACLAIALEVPGPPREEVSLSVSARPTGGGWIARALVRPSAWANAKSVTLVSLSLAGRPLPSDCLPATLRVGFNHSRAPAGAVHAAAKAGDVAALQAALDAGGSTEEADTVRGGGRGERIRGREPHHHPMSWCAGRLDALPLGRRQRQPRGPPHSPSGRCQPGCNNQGETTIGGAAGNVE